MKKLISSLSLALLASYGFGQAITPEHAGGRAAIIKKEKLNNARLVSDLFNGSPVGCRSVIDYVSVQISATCDGKPFTAKSNSKELTAEQQHILASADMGTEILIKTNFTFKDPATNNIAVNEVESAFTPGPQVEAEYPGGIKEMEQYIKENFITKVATTIDPVKTPQLSFAFTVNEQGQVDNATIHLTSANPKIDKLLLEAVNSMPKWKPAQDSKGAKIKQQFKFSIGTGC